VIVSRSVIAGFFAVLCSTSAQIPKPADAPRPLPPRESQQRVQLPPGYLLKLVAAEPLIREPSGTCWDERGRLFVCELHGYNLEGQFDIDALNQTGQLDREVRRIQADERAKTAALAETFGTIKLLVDTNADGLMDQARVFADRLPPAYGICPANGGIIVACAPDILFLADRDDDGVAEIRQTLFSGFATGPLERGINQPQWGLDGWIYFGRGHGGGKITGPRLGAPVPLPNSDFRIRPDGSAIEPITGTTHTFGHAFTEDGERFTTTTSLPGRYITPLPWLYLARNPDAAAPAAEQNAADYTRVFPLASPHPWRTRRAEDPGFSKFYRDRYGPADSDPGGWFTSGCGPLVYQDVALPPDCRGNYFVCEPAQNLIHRAIIERDGPTLRLRRHADEQQREFLASADPWFHPIHLAHAPDGAICITDMYREIIEDYSAVPRYLQQQYGLTNGLHHGRIWKLTHRDAPPAPAPDMSRLTPSALAQQIGSPHFWRRETARRLLIERNTKAQANALATLARQSTNTATALNALYALQGLNALSSDDAAAALRNANSAVRRHGLRLAEPWLGSHPELFAQAAAMVDASDPSLLLQVALTLGTTNQDRAAPALAALARRHGQLRWMPNAILCGLHQRGGHMLRLLLDTPENLAQAKPLLEPLCASIGARRDPAELEQTLGRLAETADASIQLACLRGLQAGLKGGRGLQLAAPVQHSLMQLMGSADEEVRRLATALQPLLAPLDPKLRATLLAQAAQQLKDSKSSPTARLAAVNQLATSDETNALSILIAAWEPNTPQVREAILDALFLRRDRLPLLLGALEKKQIDPRTLSAFQRVTLLEHDDASLRQRAAQLIRVPARVDEALFKRYAAALNQTADQARGERVFREHCSTCHQAQGIGFAVGPDLTAEFQRADEAFLKDILAPNDALSAGYATCQVETAAGESFTGILASETATTLTLRLPAGVEQIILRKNLARVATLAVSLMPEALIENLQPQDVADVIAFLRGRGNSPAPRPQNRLVLFDDEPEFIPKLREGKGQAAFETSGAYSGSGCLSITPLQRFSAAIPDWGFKIVEKPASGEFRYLRLAWKAPEGQGAMIELAAAGRWPDADTPQRRYYAGSNTTPWQARQISPQPPRQWRVVTFDLWKDCGPFTLTGIAPTALGGPAYFDRIELLREVAP
jgi:putative membrane-bound dehydrogenase-like protein